tara:strand:- start:2564 stop:3088 length:525 start_codon:yes stop_codon:yes gene_type:complete
MASNFRTTLINNLTIGTASTGLFDASGNALSTANIVGSGNYAYSAPIEVDNLSEDYILTATCDGCTVEIKLEMSPDGINWCPCVLSGGSNCEFECTANAGDCTTKVIDVNILPFIRVKIGNAGSTGGTCDVQLYYDYMQEQVSDVSIGQGIDETSPTAVQVSPPVQQGINVKVT